ncbi:Sec14p-like phosphatidylinositol transfer family protein [Zea mays]|uniref:Sec14p-like phosphatidylinositol transfer family protein n=1 Tax=Zea mays TaxID=4577 RepID=A0A1D6P385_MAIZE|nr:Sec14p-like phosphatidylinositol transfer family protein [Zea mays]
MAAEASAVQQLAGLLDQVDAPLKKTFELNQHEYGSKDKFTVVKVDGLADSLQNVTLFFDLSHTFGIPGVNSFSYYPREIVFELSHFPFIFQNVHQGYPTETLLRFLKAREWHVNKAHRMLEDSLNWRMQNEIDSILEKPIIPVDLYRSIRDTQLIGLSGYSKEGIPVFAVGVGLSTYDKASVTVNYYVQSHIQINEYRDRFILPTVTKKYGRPITTCIKVLDMTGLKLSALHQMKIVTAISTVDDLNYPEKTETYYIVNAPYIFSACWKVVKPLLQERTRKKVHVLRGCGRDELLQIMDYSSLPHFCRQEGSGSSKHSSGDADNCFSLDHPFHQELYSFIQEQALNQELIKQGSLHVKIPEQDPEDAKIVEVIEAEFHKLGVQNGSANGIDQA